VELSASGDEACNDGTLTFTATAGFTTYVFKVDDVQVQSSDDNEYSYPADPDTDCHTVSVTATDASSCEATDTVKVTQCVTSTVADGACPSP
jgi:hypothetical protein